MKWRTRREVQRTTVNVINGRKERSYYELLFPESHSKLSYIVAIQADYPLKLESSLKTENTRAQTNEWEWEQTNEQNYYNIDQWNIPVQTDILDVNNRNVITWFGQGYFSNWIICN